MKLLKKEFLLAANPLSFLFLLFAAMVFIPSYPALVGGFFVTLGISYSFQFLGESNDILYTALLPVRKRDTVTAKFLFVLLLECVAFVLFFACVLVRTYAMRGSAVYAQAVADGALMPPNFAFLGFLLVLFSLFPAVFLRGFFKTGYKFGMPFLKYSIAAFVWIAVVEVLYHLPGLAALGAVAGDDLTVSLLVLLGGAVEYVAVFILSYRASVKAFEKIDL